MGADSWQKGSFVAWTPILTYLSLLKNLSDLSLKLAGSW
jgi:hypothetical protein